MFLSSNPPFEVTPHDVSWMASISYTGTLISVIICYTLAGKVSPKVFIFGCTSTFAISWLLILTTSSIIVVIVCLFFYGVAASMLVITGQLYFAEIASPKNREILSILYFVATALGIQCEYPLSIFNNYRLLAIFPLAFSLITLAMSFFMMESPCYLIHRGRDDLAKKNLMWLHNRSNMNDVVADLESSKKYVEEQKGKGISKLKTVFLPENMKLTAVLLLVDLGIINCYTILTAYGSLMIQNFEHTINEKLFVTVISCLRVICTVLGLVTIKIFKRKAMLVFGFAFNGLIQLCCAFCYYIEAQYDYKIRYLAIIIAILLIIFVIMDHTSHGPAIAVLKAEIFPYKLKEFYTSLLAFTSDWFAFATVKTYFTLSKTIGAHFLLLSYSCCYFVVALTIYLFISDTKGKSLLQIRTEYKSTSTHEFACNHFGTKKEQLPEFNLQNTTI